MSRAPQPAGGFGLAPAAAGESAPAPAGSGAYSTKHRAAPGAGTAQAGR